MTMFSPGEVAFLAHRLHVPDALHEVMQDDEDDVIASFSLEEVERACTNLLAAIETQTVEKIVGGLSSLDDWILRDVVEGSTYCATVFPSRRLPEAERIKKNALYRAATRAARGAVAKLRAAGFECGSAPEA